jgi:porin
VAFAALLVSQAIMATVSAQDNAAPVATPAAPTAQPAVPPPGPTHGAEIAPSPAAAPPSEVIPKDPLISPDPAQPVLQPWYDLKQQADKDASLKISPSYTFLYEVADKTANSDRNDLFQGRLDLSADWTLLRDGKNTGSIGFLLRSGENIFTSQHFAMGPAVGDNMIIDSLQGNGENHPISINLLYWRQSFLDDDLAFYIGKIHPNQHMDLDPFNNDETSQFLGLPFDGNVSNPQLGNYSVGAAVEWRFYEDFHIHALVMDSQGAPNLPPNTTFDGKYYEGVELGWQPKFEGLGKGNYRIDGWYDQAKDGGEGAGMSVGFSQEIGEGWAPFGRWGTGDPDVSSFRQMLSGGIANVAPFGRRGDMFGIGAAWGDPSDNTVRQEVMLETFYRLQITDSLQFSPDVQCLLPPADRGAEDTVFVFNARLKLIF